MGREGRVLQHITSGDFKRVIEWLEIKFGAPVTNHYLVFLHLSPVLQINATYHTLTSISLIWLRHFPAISSRRKKIMLARGPSVEHKNAQEAAIFLHFLISCFWTYCSGDLQILTQSIRSLTWIWYVRLVFLLSRMTFKIFLSSNLNTWATQNDGFGLMDVHSSLGL